MHPPVGILGFRETWLDMLLLALRHLDRRKVRSLIVESLCIQNVVDWMCEDDHCFVNTADPSKSSLAVNVTVVWLPLAISYFCDILFLLILNVCNFHFLGLIAFVVCCAILCIKQYNFTCIILYRQYTVYTEFTVYMLHCCTCVRIHFVLDWRD